MRKTIRTGDEVRLSRNNKIPVRYQGRTAFVVDTITSGRGIRAFVDFPGRRVTPLEVPASQLTLAG